jgi:hypothetical protein
MSLDPDVIPHSVVFGGGGIEISYMEARHRYDFGHKLETIVLDPSQFSETAEELVQVIVQLIDEFAVAVRRPPDTIPGGRR